MSKANPRPRWDNSMVEELAKTFGHRINEWCNDETPIERCINAAAEVLQWNEDGFGYAKGLEKEGFSPDAELVSILEDVDHEKSIIVERAVVEWAKELPADTLKYKDGDKVMAHLYGYGEVECDVVMVNPLTAEYGVWMSLLPYQRGRGYRIIGFEHVISEVKNDT